MWVPEKKKDEWTDIILPGNVFLVEHGYATSYPVQDGKYHNTNIKLDHNKTRHMATPMWAK